MKLNKKPIPQPKPPKRIPSKQKPAYPAKKQEGITVPPVPKPPKPLPQE